MNQMIDRLQRQHDLLPTEVLGVHLDIIGVGGIGSPAAFTLAKMGFTNLTLWDPDIVEEVNIGTQMFSYDDIGLNKAHAMARILERHTNIEIPYKELKWDLDLVSPGMIITAVDNMDTRRQVAEQVWGNSAVQLVIDPRMGAHDYRIDCYRPGSIDDCEAYYANTLYSDEDAVDLPCTARATFWNGQRIAAHIGLILYNWFTDGRMVSQMSGSQYLGFNRMSDWRYL